MRHCGTYDEDGQRSGKGTAFYPGGYLCIGDYEDNVRSGNGNWYWMADKTYHYSGEWADDMPNGYGELNLTSGYRHGNFANGLEDGKMIGCWPSWCEMPHEYNP